MANEDEKLSGALQENLLCLLCFSEDYCKIIRASVQPKLFESAVFREVATHAIDYIDQYKQPIGEHLPDHIEHILNGEDRRKAKTYQQLLDNLFLSKDGINGEYVVTKLQDFVTMQTFKSGLVQSFESLQEGDVKRAREEMLKALGSAAVAFSPGIALSSHQDVADLLHNPMEEGFPMGIKVFDDLGIYPRRKSLSWMLAPRGRGKSWWLVQCAKMALLNRLPGVIISLEMSEKEFAMRCLQSFFSISMYDAEIEISNFVKDRTGNLESLAQETVVKRTLRDDSTKGYLIKRAKKEFARRPMLRVKQFAPGTLDLAGLNAYLDALERYERFVPAWIGIDYPAIMKIDSKNFRTAYGQTVEGLRGIGIERNAAIIAVGQGNRESESAKYVTSDMAAEDISVLATADRFFTYSQTPEEHKLGLARIFAAKSRNTKDKISALITQSYAMGQFCLDSTLINADYWNMLTSRGDRNERRRRRGEDD